MNDIPGLDQHKFVFVGGLHRSGTTILAQTLAEHPSISGFDHSGVPADEGQHLQTVYPTIRQKILRYSQDPHSLVFRAIRKLYKRRVILFGFYKNVHLTEISPLVSKYNRQRLFKEWGRYWDLDKPVLVEKSPPNLVKTRFLQAMFPGAFFIIITRHPIATALATQRLVKWNITHSGALFNHWITSHEIFAADRTYLQNVITVRYEDFASSPETVLRRVYSFLGLDYYPSSINILKDTNQIYFRKWREWRTHWVARSYTDALIERYEAQMNRMGYSLLELPE